MLSPDRTKSEDTLRQLEEQNKLLKALTTAQSQFIVDANPRTLFNGLLEDLLTLTQSEYGFIGEILYNENGQHSVEALMKIRGQPFVKAHAITNIAWDEETQAFYEANALAGMEFHNLKTLFGAVILTGKPVIANSPYTDPRRGGLPKGHPPLNAFLGIPFYCNKHQLLGMVGIANRPGGYDESLITYLEPFLATCSNVIAAHRNDKRRQQAEAALQLRTIELQQLNDKLQQEIADRKQIEKALIESEVRERQKATQLELAINDLKSTQSQLIQSEKMSSIGQLVAGVAHEINNPVNFIYGNLVYARESIADLLALINLYQQHYPQTDSQIQDWLEEIDWDFLQEDLPRTIDSMQVGAERIREIVLSLRNFSRLDEATKKTVNIHEGLDSTLLILQHRFKKTAPRPQIEVVKSYGDLPLVECYPGQLNQVFMNILANAIDALEEVNGATKNTAAGFPLPNPKIWIRTEVINSTQVAIHIADNGPGISETFKSSLFKPFSTTKPIGKGTGLGLSISYEIVVKKHKGELRCVSTPGEGTEFIIEIPLSLHNEGAVS